MDFERVLRTLADFFVDSGAGWGVIGGLAMAVHGALRTTLDVDIRVLLDAPGVDRAEIKSYFVRYGLEELLDRLDEN